MKTLTLFAFALMASSALADEWSSPKPRTYTSETGRFVLRVLPGGSETPKNATAVVFELNQAGDRYEQIREFPLLNRYSPVDACISDTAEVATFDDWGRAGYELVVVWYAADGKKRKEYTLEELIPDKPRTEILENHHSKSSIWWRKDPGHRGSSLPCFDGRYLVINDVVGGQVVLTQDPESTLVYHPAKDIAK